ncbi:hypothetical protein ONE63_007450 [Megalurothrips usitatus]|uniref:Ribosomal RNA processing protein 1 homolog n=1 Tax=Megalurothrips usitatus TaxID=439358 RepID=A0AAV7XRW3_9NEOP|nr:hypothetical protein ONE63_007450 [Megalurothrips usitatus]
MVVKKSVKSAKSSKSRAVNTENIKHEKNPKKVLLVAQEIQFAKVLAGNDPNLRARGVKRLHKWLRARSQNECDLKKDDFARLWKGLYYCMWMADKPLFQEELAETISSLVHCFGHSSPATQFMAGFFRMMAQEWIGIDQHRFDKFLMLVRRFLRQCLVFVQQKEWDLEIAEQVSLAFQSTVLPNHAVKADIPPPSGLVMHFSDIFLEELAKVSKGDIDEKIFLCFLTPFTLHLVTVKDARLRRHIQDSVFYRLINQTPVALEHEEKFAAWSQMGFPGGSIDVMQRVEDGNDEQSDFDDEDDELIQNAVNGQDVLDPRAGGVDVELPLLNFKPESIINHLKEHQFKKYTNSKSRKRLTNLIKAFEKIAESKYPFPIPKVPAAGKGNLRRLRSKASEDLYKYERQLYEDDESEEEDDDDALSDNEDDEDKAPNSSILNEEDHENEDSVQSEKPPPKKLQKLQKLQKASPKVSPKKQRLSGLKSSAQTKLTNGKSSGKSEEDIEVEKLSQIQITPSDSAAERVLPDTKAKSSEGTESGTHALLQHLAPHLVGSKKLKRRASCDAALQTTPVIKGAKTDSISSPKSEGKKSKRKSLGWDEPLQEGEYEIVIPREKIVAQKKRLSDANNITLSPSTAKLDLKNPFSTPVSGKKLRTPGSSSKKVNFIPERNMAQSESEYFRTLRANPEIPYDANKEPSRGVLKPSPYSSPVNPFYKRKLKI